MQKVFIGSVLLFSVLAYCLCGEALAPRPLSENVKWYCENKPTYHEDEKIDTIIRLVRKHAKGLCVAHTIVLKGVMDKLGMETFMIREKFDDGEDYLLYSPIYGWIDAFPEGNADKKRPYGIGWCNAEYRSMRNMHLESIYAVLRDLKFDGDETKFLTDLPKKLEKYKKQPITWEQEVEMTEILLDYVEDSFRALTHLMYEYDNNKVSYGWFKLEVCGYAKNIRHYAQGVRDKKLALMVHQFGDNIDCMCTVARDRTKNNRLIAKIIMSVHNDVPAMRDYWKSVKFRHEAKVKVEKRTRLYPKEWAVLREVEVLVERLESMQGHKLFVYNQIIDIIHEHYVNTIVKAQRGEVAMPNAQRYWLSQDFKQYLGTISFGMDSVEDVRVKLESCKWLVRHYEERENDMRAVRLMEMSS